MDNVIFNPTTHEYYNSGGRVPGVTDVIKGAGLIDTTFFTGQHRDRGIRVHLATQDIDKNLCNIAVDIPDNIDPYKDAYKQFLADVNPKWQHSEYIVYNRQYNYAGIADRIGEMFGEDVIVDIKSGIKDRSHGVQLAAYERAWGKPVKRYGLYLKNDGTYKLEKYDNPNDFRVFIAALTIYIWKGIK